MSGRRIAGAIAAVALVAGGCGGGDPQPSPAEQVPRLAIVLQRVDAALAEHRFAAARQQLRTLKADVVDARDGGHLREADAQRILTAISQLLGLLPDAPSPSEIPEADDPSTSGSSKPSAPASSRPERPKTTAPTTSESSLPSPTLSTTATASPISTPLASPTDAATRDTSPTASASTSP